MLVCDRRHSLALLDLSGSAPCVSPARSPCACWLTHRVVPEPEVVLVDLDDDTDDDGGDIAPSRRGGALVMSPSYESEALAADASAPFVCARVLPKALRAIQVRAPRNLPVNAGYGGGGLVRSAVSVGLGYDGGSSMASLVAGMRATAAMDLVHAILMGCIVCTDARVRLRCPLLTGDMRVVHVVGAAASASSPSSLSSSLLTRFARITATTRVTLTLENGAAESLPASIPNYVVGSPATSASPGPAVAPPHPASPQPSDVLRRGALFASTVRTASTETAPALEGVGVAPAPASAATTAPRRHVHRRVLGCNAAREAFLELALFPFRFASELQSFERSVSAGGFESGASADRAQMQESSDNIPSAGGSVAPPRFSLAPARGILLHGPPGVGKTLLVQDVAAAFCEAINGASARVFVVNGPQLLSGVPGESESRLRSIFRAARAFAAFAASGSARAAENEVGTSLSGGGGGVGVTLPTAARLSIIFLDELDALCPRRSSDPTTSRVSQGDAPSATSARIVTQLLTLMDSATSSSPDAADMALPLSAAAGTPSRPGPAHGLVLVVGATNRPDALDPALRRPGRFDREIRLQPPDASARLEILEHLLQGLLPSVQPQVEPAGGSSLPPPSASPPWLRQLATRCVGYVGADLEALVREAAECALTRQQSASSLLVGSAPPPAQPLQLSPSDFESAYARTAPSALRDYALELGGGGSAGGGGGGSALVGAPPPPGGVASAVEDDRSREAACWSGIGGMGPVIERLRTAVVAPFTRARDFRAFGLLPPRGVLLHGPPGNSKTSLVRALSRALGAAFFPLSGAEVYSAYVGEAEGRIREAFARARGAAPAVIFLDEIDALVGSRGSGGESGSSSSSSSAASVGILTTLLTEMDGVVGAEGVLVVGATNRIEALDAALLRPGRLEIHCLVPTPDAAGRAEVLRIHAPPLPSPTAGAAADDDVPDFDALAAETEGWSGAELANLCREAAMDALREDLLAAACVRQRHWRNALERLGAARFSSLPSKA